MVLWLCQFTEGGPQRVNHAAEVINGLIYSFGGFNTNEGGTNVNEPMDVHVYNTATCQWKKFSTPSTAVAGNPPPMSYGHSVVTYNEKMYLFGGRNESTGVNNHVHAFDPAGQTLWEQLTTSGSKPYGRDGHTATVVKNEMYIYGGFEDRSGEFSKTVFCLNLDTLVWTFINTTGIPASWRDFHTATHWNGRLVIFGGRGDFSGFIHSGREVYCNKIHFLDLATYQWTSPKVSGYIPDGRRSHSAFKYNEKIYIFGGYNGQEKQHYNDLYCFDPVTLEWSRVLCHGKSPSPRRRAAMIHWEGRVYLFGGTSPENKDGSQELLELGDTFILEMDPTLYVRCLKEVVDKKIDPAPLPAAIKEDMKSLFKDQLNLDLEQSKELRVPQMA